MPAQATLAMDVDPTPPKGARRHLDAYYTPTDLARALVRKLVRDGWWVGGDVLEPSAGQGSFLRAARDLLGPQRPTAMDAVELDEGRARILQSDGWVTFCADFLTCAMPATGYSLILGNPPFNGAEAHVRRSLALRTYDGCVAFLLRLAFLESQERRAFWSEHPASKVYVLSERPSFTGGSTDNAAYGFFVWSKRQTGPSQLEVVSWR